MVFSLYTNDLTYGGLLCTITGCGTNSGQIVCGLICRRLGKQRIQVIVAATCMGTFLGGKPSLAELVPKFDPTFQLAPARPQTIAARLSHYSTSAVSVWATWRLSAPLLSELHAETRLRLELPLG
jgi:hypothetical protein